jgi:hypothetical protein
MITPFEDALVCALHGREYLDRTYPDWWFPKIDRERLDMNLTNDCILGQLFGDYDRSPEWMRDFQWRIEHGFTTLGDMDVLTAAWRQLLWPNI